MSLTVEEHSLLESLFNNQYTIEETINEIHYYSYWTYYHTIYGLNVEFAIENLDI